MRAKSLRVEVGARYGRLVITKADAGRTGSEMRLACEATCDCGKESLFIIRNVVIGRVASCGCLRSDMASERVLLRPNVTAHHDYASERRTHEYIAWAGMKRRCSPGNGPDHRDYYGRGIRVCERWMVYSNFLADMGRRPGDKGSIDRIDNDGHYEPGNCRWATSTDQARNRRSTRWIEMRGERKCMAEWCQLAGIDSKLADTRMKMGWSEEDAIFRPVRANSRRTT